MNQISNFLEKFRNLITTDAAKRAALSDAIFKVLRSTIDPSDIKIKKYTAELPFSPIMRTEILIHKAEILEELGKTAPNARITDIR